jgi:L-xylulokinase
MPGYYLLSENSYTAASNLEWFIDRFMQQEKEEAKAGGYSIYKTVNEMVASVDTRDCPIIFLPFLYWSNANIDAKSTFIGLSGIHTKAHMLRAIFEGIVFSHHYHLDKLYRIKSKENFDSARISGGGAKSELWVQMFADILGLPMEVSAVDELGTLGSAICAGLGSGLFSDSKEAAERFISIKKIYYPNEEITSFYNKKYSLYKKIIDSLDEVWADFGGLVHEN